METIGFDVRERVGWVALQRPERLNSITEAVLDDLETVIDQVERDDGIRAVALTGAGEVFSVGLDLALLERAFEEADVFRRILHRFHTLLLRLEGLDAPTVAAVNGTEHIWDLLPRNLR